MGLVFERVPNSYKTTGLLSGEPKTKENLADFWRAEIPGGWLVFCRYKSWVEGGAPVFIPDPEHEWQV
jgi:hypothetical protein